MSSGDDGGGGKDFVVSVTITLRNGALHACRWKFPIVYPVKQSRRSIKVAIGQAIDWTRADMTKAKIKGRSDIRQIVVAAIKVD